MTVQFSHNISNKNSVFLDQKLPKKVIPVVGIKTQVSIIYIYIYIYIYNQLKGKTHPLHLFAKWQQAFKNLELIHW